MHQIERASILATERELPFVKKLQKELSDHHIPADLELIQNSDPGILKKEFNADLIALDIPNAFNQQFSRSTEITRFVANNAFIREKVIVGDVRAADILTQNLHERRIGAHISEQLNLRALRMAKGNFADLENVTQQWADAHSLIDNFVVPKFITLDLFLKEELRYGENPQQHGAFYQLPGDRRPGIGTAKQLQGRQLSFNNLADTDAAYECVAEFDPRISAACVIVKHANPCGVATGTNLVEAYERALACDPISAFGGIVAFNQKLDAEAARAIISIFTEVIIAPDATAEARKVIATKKNLRLLLAGEVPDPRSRGFCFRSVAGGLLMQTRDTKLVDELEPHFEFPTEQKPTARQLEDLKFAFRVAKHVKSNAIVYAKDGATVGIGAGQMSRVDAAELAALKAKKTAKSAGLAEHTLLEDSVVASDAFFPFKDGLIAAVQAGAKAVIQPGGSVRDDEVIKEANARGIAMVFTGTRHFRH
jgi:AICAR transformylase/IMP cyclohydrolase PurH